MKKRFLGAACTALLFTANAHAFIYCPVNLASTSPGSAGYSANAVSAYRCDSGTIENNGGSGSTSAVAGPSANMMSSAYLDSSSVSASAVGSSSDTRNLISSAAISDTLTFSGLTNSTAQITAVLHFSGTMGGNGYVTASASADGGQQLYRSFSPGAMPSTLSFSFNVSNNIPIVITSFLESTAYGAGSFASIRDYMTLVLPTGVSFTSASGVFGTAAVPEPSTWMLFGLGLAGMLMMARGRRSAAFTDEALRAA